MNIFYRICRNLTLLALFSQFVNVLTAQSTFTNVAANLGIEVEVDNTPLGNGISFVDFNKDGWDDLSICTGADDLPRFFMNIDGVFFAEVNLNLNLIPAVNKQISWVDYDNDGDRDLFITSNDIGNRLYNNNGNLIFNEVTLEAGLIRTDVDTYGASWGDINNDGCLDLYISNHTGTISGTPNLFYRNNCDGTFSEVTDEVGLSNILAPTFCSGFLDFNNDGWIDLYVSNDRFAPNFLYKNNGDGTFIDVSESSGTGVVMDAMSVTVGDINRDGFMDIYVTNTPVDISTSFSGNALFLNNGDETFTNVSEEVGTMFYGFAWGASFLDVENDGDLDLYVSSSYDGSVEDYPSNAIYEKTEAIYLQNTEMGFEGDENISYGNAIGDINNDGLMDIAVLNNNDSLPSLWENKNFSPGNYLKVNLIGESSNYDGVGAQLEISVEGQRQYLTVMCGEGYISQSSFTKHFGLGEAEQIEYLKVKWPSGVEDIIDDPRINQTLSVVEGSTLSAYNAAENTARIYPSITQDWIHIDASYENYKVKLFNALGQMVLESQSSSSDMTLNLSFLENGFYLMMIESLSGLRYKRRIVKF